MHAMTMSASGFAGPAEPFVTINFQKACRRLLAAADVAVLFGDFFR
jgi:spermidine synthase